MLVKEIKYCYNDISIVPAILSNVEHRGECNPYYIDDLGKKTLPIFTAPMSTVVNEQNFELFEMNNIIPILPRNISYDIRLKYLQCGKWVAVGLDEFEDLFLKDGWNFETHPYVNVLVDIANGHMRKLVDFIHEAKCKAKWLKTFKIMAGNIANPQAYYEYAKAGCDICRLNIGTGEGCITWSNLGVGYPVASLINEVYEIKKNLQYMGENTPVIVADGGVRGSKDIMIALALGADYVMIGGLLSQLIESAALTFYYKNMNRTNKCEINPFEHTIEKQSDGSFLIDNKKEVYNMYKVFYGMASRKGQEDLYGKKKRTSEGIEKVFECTTNLSKWTENITENIQSLMSYLNCFRVEDVNPEKVKCVIMSPQTRESINK